MLHLKHRILFIFLLLFSVLKAQHSKSIDSLNKLIDSTSSSQLKADAFCSLLYEYTYIDIKKAEEYGNKSLNISRETGYKHGEIEALNALSVLDKNEGNYSKAFYKLKQAVLIGEESKDNLGIAKTYQSIGDMYFVLLDYEKAINNYEKAYELNKSENNFNGCITNLSRIANRHMDIGNFGNDTSHISIAINIYKKALALSEKQKDFRKLTTMHINLADAYNILGTKDKSKQSLFHGLDFSLKSLKLARENNFEDLEALSFLNIGETYENLKHFSKALHYYEEALKKYESIKNDNWVLNSRIYIAKVFYKINNLEQATSNINKAKDLAEKLHLKKSLESIYLLLSDIYNAKKDYPKSFEYYKVYSAYKDSLMDEQNNMVTARLQTELDLEKKDKEIEELKHNSKIQEQELYTQAIQRNFLVGIIILSLILLIFVLYRYKESKDLQIKITQAKNLAEQAKAIQEQFLANTSHEIRTPMNGIVGMTELLSKTDLDAEQKEYIGAIQESSSNLLIIINDLLDLSKINSGKMTFESSPFHLDEIFKNIIIPFKKRAEEKNIKILTSMDSGISDILIGDATRLNQILLNLLNNAIKFTEKGEIKISAKIIDANKNLNKIEFSVSDTGVGIPKENLSDIFKNFAQVDSKNNRKHSGTGLGLSIVKQLVEAQNGTIKVESELNKGSVFSFILSFKEGKKGLTKNPKILSPKNDKNNSITILIVDDNQINQQVAKLTLEKLNFKTITVSGAKEAFEVLKSNLINLILMDVTMPEMDGFEATKYIRNNFPAPLNKIPIIAMTASALVGDKEKCLSEGMDDYISKPFSTEELIQKIAPFVSDSIDLSLLTEKAEGDIEYMKDIIQSYITEMPKYLAEFNFFVAKNDIQQIAAQAHKMKSPAALLGATELNETLSLIEKNGLKNNTSINYSKLGETVNFLCNKSVDELKIKLENL